MKNYGITEAEYKLLLDYTDGTCWICSKPPKEGKNLSVDHDHQVEKTWGIRESIRGILCFMCNRRLIGRRRREHAELYRSAYEYLLSTKAQELLGGSSE